MALAQPVDEERLPGLYSSFPLPHVDAEVGIEVNSEAVSVVVLEFPDVVIPQGLLVSDFALIDVLSESLHFVVGPVSLIKLVFFGPNYFSEAVFEIPLELSLEDILRGKEMDDTSPLLLASEELPLIPPLFLQFEHSFAVELVATPLSLVLEVFGKMDILPKAVSLVVLDFSLVVLVLVVVDSNFALQNVVLKHSRDFNVAGKSDGPLSAEYSIDDLPIVYDSVSKDYFGVFVR